MASSIGAAASVLLLAFAGGIGNVAAAAGDGEVSTPASADAALQGRRAPLSPVHVNGVTLHYEVRGAGEPIVFVHGGLADYREWQPVAGRLESRFRTVTYSRRYNYPNANPLVAKDHSALVEAEDLKVLLQALKLGGPVHLVGVSYGAYSALFVALRHPNMLRSLTIVEPPVLSMVPPTPEGTAVTEQFLAMWRRSSEATARDDIAASLRAAFDWLIGPAGIDRLTPVDLEVVTANAREWQALTLSGNPFPPITADDLRGLRVPVLMISGGRSYRLMQLIDGSIEPLLPSGRRLIVPTATHDVCREAAALCAGAIGDFIAATR